jgi:integrase
MSYYSLYWRKDVGRYYYRVNLPDGTRSTGRSTHEKTKAKANDFCQQLIAVGRIWEGENSTFGAYVHTNHWFEPGECPYIRDRLADSTPDRPGISESYIKRLQTDLRLHILPYFQGVRINKIIPETLRQFRVHLQEKGLANKTINNTMDTLRIILNWALDNDVILRDPFRGIKYLAADENSRDAFNICELRRMFKIPWKNQLIWLYCLTSAVTGMRLCEVGALRDSTIFAEYFDVKDQWNHKLLPIKTKEKRKIPLPARLREMLMAYTKKDSFTFAGAFGNPVHFSIPEDRLKKAIPPEALFQKAKRQLSFHSLRHFFNTWLLAQNVPLPKVQAVMGHSSGKGTMTDTYTHWQPLDYPEVFNAQEKLLEILLENNPNFHFS